MQKHLVLAGICLAAVMAPSLASGQEEEIPEGMYEAFRCKGALSNQNPVGGVEIAYRVNCSSTITSYSIVASQEVDGFNPYSPLSMRSDESAADVGKAFECQGSIPGQGFGCVGGDQPPETYATGDFTTSEPACNPRNRARSLRAWVVAQHIEGEGSKAKTVTSEPFRLKRTFKCVKAANKPRRNR